MPNNFELWPTHFSRGAKNFLRPGYGPARGSQTRGDPRTGCGPRGRFVRPAMLFGNFQVINICVIDFIHRCLNMLGQRVNKFLLKTNVETGRNELPITHDNFRMK